MEFADTEVPGVVVVSPEPVEDERGLFARTFSADEFHGRGLPTSFPECSTSFNRRSGTLRGLHHQAGAFAEDKLVRCTRGAVFDVAVDLRPSSPSYTRWVGVELTAENRQALFVPKGCGHGFLTLEDDTELLYHITTPYVAQAAAGIRWDDPTLSISWPRQPQLMSRRDATLPML